MFTNHRFCDSSRKINDDEDEDVKNKPYILIFKN